MHMYVHPHICISFLCRNDACHGSEPPEYPPTPFHSHEMSFWNQDQSWIVFIFFLCAQSFSACSGDSHGTMVVKNPSSFFFFCVELLVSASAGGTAPVYGMVHRLLSLNSRVCGEYEVYIFLIVLLTHFALLICFRHSLERLDLIGGCWTLWGPPVVRNSSPGAISFFRTPRSILAHVFSFLSRKISIFGTSYQWPLTGFV